MKTIKIAIKNISRNKIQPGGRGVPAEIYESIAKFGQRTPISVQETAPGLYVALDGHTRMAALEALGHTHVDAVVQDDRLSPTVSYLIENLHKRRLSGPQIFQCWEQGSEADRKQVLKLASSHVRDNIQGMVEIFGTRRAEELAQRGTAPGISRTTRSTHASLSRFFNGQTPPLKTIGEWIVAHRGAQANLAHAFPKVADDSKRMWARLAKAIANNEDFPRSKWDGKR